MKNFISKSEGFVIQIAKIDKNNQLGNQVIKSFIKPTWKSIVHPPIMQADPFLFVHNNTLFLFYEEMLFERGLGVIKMIFTKDLVNWSNPVQITHEPDTHFSYPFVFEQNGDVFLMPETGCDHNIRLYRAKDDSLSKFELYKIILQRKDLSEINSLTFDYADSCILKYNGIFYLFTSVYKSGEYYLHLFVSNRFDGNYVEHPCSPIVKGNRTGRCGGSVFERDGKLYRPCQDCTSVYGGQLHIMQIEELSPTTYCEKEVAHDIIPVDEPYFREGGHHLNLTSFNGEDIIARDARYTCTFLLERIRYKLVTKLNLRFLD